MNPFDNLQYEEYQDFLNRGQDATSQGTILPQEGVDQGLVGLEGGTGGGIPAAGGASSAGGAPTMSPSGTLHSVLKGLGLLKEGAGYLSGQSGMPGDSGFTFSQPGYGVRAPADGDPTWSSSFEEMYNNAMGPSNYVEMGGIDTNWLNNWGVGGGSGPEMLGGAAELQSVGDAASFGSGWGGLLGKGMGALGAAKGLYDIFSGPGLNTEQGGTAMLGLASSLMGMAGAGPLGLGVTAAKMIYDLARMGQKKNEAERAGNRTAQAGQLNSALGSGWGDLGNEEALLSRLNQNIPTANIRTGDLLADYGRFSNYGQPQLGDNEYGMMERMGIAPSQEKDVALQLLSQLGFKGSQGADYGGGIEKHGELNNLMEYMNWSGMPGPSQYQDLTGGINPNFRYTDTVEHPVLGPILNQLSQLGLSRGVNSNYAPDARLQAMLDQMQANRSASQQDDLSRGYIQEYNTLAGDPQDQATAERLNWLRAQIPQYWWDEQQARNNMSTP